MDSSLAGMVSLFNMASKSTRDCLQAKDPQKVVSFQNHTDLTQFLPVQDTSLHCLLTYQGDISDFVVG